VCLAACLLPYGSTVATVVDRNRKPVLVLTFDVAELHVSKGLHVLQGTKIFNLAISSKTSVCTPIIHD
jgi:hypothetical protein